MLLLFTLREKTNNRDRDADDQPTARANRFA
jgi:hypothetical protein